jgi:AraC-like DNA-binding protein
VWGNAKEFALLCGPDSHAIIRRAERWSLPLPERIFYHPIDDAPQVTMPVMEQEMAFAGFRLAYVPPGDVETAWHLEDNFIDVNLHHSRPLMAWNSDRLVERDLDSQALAFAPVGATYKLRVTNTAPGIVMSYRPGFENRLAGENLRRDVREWRLVEYEPDPAAAQLGRMAQAWFEAEARPDPLYLESLGVAIFARGAHLALRDGQLWRPAAVTGYEARVQRAIDYAHANLAGPVALTEMAAAAYVSPYHFLRVFKAATGETPHTFVIRLRVERARHLLLSRDWSVEFIALECGFASASHLGQAFRKLTGETPSAFRQSQMPVTRRLPH